MPIHEFWVELLPQFQDGYTFIYYLLDTVTVLFIFRIFSDTVCMIFGGRRGSRW